MSIYIKKENRGKFTKSAKAAGESVLGYAHSVLNNPNATKLQKKRAQFAINSKKFKHEEGGFVHKPFGHRSNLDNGWIPTKELKKNHPCVSFQSGGKSLSKRASDAYLEFSNSGWGTAYDLLNLGLYAAAPFTGGATLVPAMAMSIGQGIAGANNMYQEGVNLNNAIDVVGGLVAAPGKTVAKPIMKAMGKTTKIVKHAPLLTKTTAPANRIILSKNYEPLWKLALDDKRYVPYASYIYTNLGVNTALPLNDLKDNYSTYLQPYILFSNSMNLVVKEEHSKRKNK